MYVVDMLILPSSLTFFGLLISCVLLIRIADVCRRTCARALAMSMPVQFWKKKKKV